MPLSGDREEIYPEPGFVVKTIDDAGRKIFINVCGHAKLQAPGSEWANGKLPEHVETALANLEDPEAVQQLRFPLSVSEGRNELDKTGAPCTVYDAVFNDEVVKQAIAYRKLKVFLVELCLQWVGQKYSLSLDPKYKLPHRKYMGDKPEMQTIRVDRKSMIEEINEPDEEPSFPLRSRPAAVKASAPTAAAGGGFATAGDKGGGGGRGGGRSSGGGDKGGAGTAGASGLPGAMASQATISGAGGGSGAGATGADVAAAAAATTGLGRSGESGGLGRVGFSFGKLPEVQHVVEYVNVPVTDVAVHVPLPEGVKVSQVRVCVVMEGVTVDMPGHQPLRVQLPFAVNGDEAAAGYDEVTRTVTLRAPYMAYAAVLEAHGKVGTHAVGEVKLSSSFLDI